MSLRRFLLISKQSGAWQRLSISVDQWPPPSDLNRRGSTRPPFPDAFEQFLATISSSQGLSNAGRAFTLYKDIEHEGVFMFREEASPNAMQCQSSGWPTGPNEQLISLETLLTPSMDDATSRRPSLPIRLSLAVTVMAAALQLHQTGWLEDLGKKRIFLSPDFRPFLEHCTSLAM